MLIYQRVLPKMSKIYLCLAAGGWVGQECLGGIARGGTGGPHKRAPGMYPLVMTNIAVE